MKITALPGFLWQRRALAQRKRWTREALEAFRAKGLAKLRAHALAHSPFYRRFHKGLEDAPLERLPVLHKAGMMEHFDDFVTDRAVRLADVQAHLRGPEAGSLYRGRYVVTATSGTTGRQGLFLSDPAEWRAVVASYGRPYDWAGLRFRLYPPLKVALISTRTPWHQSCRVGQTLESPLIPTLRLDANDPLDLIREKLAAFAPEVIISYPSVLRMLAEDSRAGGAALPRPGSVFPVAEVLSDGTRRLIRETWGTEPFNVYGATESAGLASECRGHSLHTYDDLVILENVDHKDRPVPPGEWGDRILVTVLSSRTQPLIRYAISDRVRLSDRPCACGMPFGVLDAIQGREQEIIRLPGRDGDVALHPVFFRTVLEALPVKGWQVCQEAASALRIRVAAASDGAVPASLAEDLRRDLIARGASDPSVAVERVESIEKGETGKVTQLKALR